MAKLMEERCLDLALICGNKSESLSLFLRCPMWHSSG